MGFKRKFEKGDKVQIIKPNDIRNNQIGKITHYYSSYGSKGVYTVSFENGTRSYYPYELEKVEDSSNTDTKSNKLSISNFKIGMKIKVKKDFDKIVPTSTLDLFHFYHIPITMKSFEEKELIVENIGNCFITAKSFQWYPEWLEIIEEPQIFCENESSLTKVSKETGIITKVTFTLNEFKSEKLEHSKFTIL